MKKLLPYIFILNSLFVYAQINFLEGTWQGLIVKQGQPYKEANAIWFDLEINSETNELTGNSRIEIPFTDYYALKVLKGKVINKHTIEFEEVMFGNKKNSSRAYWCLIKGGLSYNDSTGYLEGHFSAPNCRNYTGKIITYRSKYKLSTTDTVSLYHSWVNNFVNDLNRGWPAYYIRDEQLRNFEFKPVIFDHDKAELKEEYKPYLNQMVDVINSHSDLRIKIIGHTNSIGSDAYNIELSERRANTVRNYLLSLGLKPDQVVIEYRGERNPAYSNQTPEGKRLNRRVDFEFI